MRGPVRALQFYQIRGPVRALHFLHIRSKDILMLLRTQLDNKSQ